MMIKLLRAVTSFFFLFFHQTNLFSNYQTCPKVADRGERINDPQKVREQGEKKHVPAVKRRSQVHKFVLRRTDATQESSRRGPLSPIPFEGNDTLVTIRPVAFEMKKEEIKKEMLE